MELNPSLRSLEAAGRPSGTGRPSIPPERAPRERDPRTSDSTERRASERRPDADGAHGAHRDDDAPRARRTNDDRARPDRAHRRADPRRDDVESDEPASDARTSATSDGRSKTSARIDRSGAKGFEQALSANEARASSPNAARSSNRSSKGSEELPHADSDALEPVVDALAIAKALPTAPATPISAPNPPGVAESVASGPAAITTAANAIEQVEGELATLTDELDATSDDASSALELLPADLEALAPRAEPDVAAHASHEGEKALPGITTRSVDAPDRPSEPARAPASPPHAPRAPDEARAADVLRQVRVHLVPDLRNAVIHLAPAELGRISIRLSVEDERLVARVRAEKREALDALEKHLPELKTALARQGLHTQEIDLALGFRDERTGNPPGERAPSRGRSSSGAELAADPSVERGAIERATLARVLADGAVDTYA